MICSGSCVRFVNATLTLVMRFTKTVLKYSSITTTKTTTHYYIYIYSLSIVQEAHWLRAVHKEFPYTLRIPTFPVDQPDLSVIYTNHNTHSLLWWSLRSLVETLTSNDPDVPPISSEVIVSLFQC